MIIDNKLKGEQEIKRTDDKIKEGDNGIVPILSIGIEEPSANVTGGNEEDNSRDQERVDILVR